MAVEIWKELVSLLGSVTLGGWIAATFTFLLGGILWCFYKRGREKGRLLLVVVARAVSSIFPLL